MLVRDVHDDRVRVAEREVELLALQVGLEATPWISRSLVKPVVTPFTMLKMIERAVPYIALAKRVSPIGATMTFLSVMVIVTTGAKAL